MLLDEAATRVCLSIGGISYCAYAQNCQAAATAGRSGGRSASGDGWRQRQSQDRDFGTGESRSLATLDSTSAAAQMGARRVEAAIRSLGIAVAKARCCSQS